MITGLYFPQFMELMLFLSPLAPKTGDTSVTQMCLRSLAFFTFVVATTCTYVKFSRRVKKRQKLYYPPKRLSICGAEYLK